MMINHEEFPVRTTQDEMHFTNSVKGHLESLKEWSQNLATEKFNTRFTIMLSVMDLVQEKITIPVLC